MNAHVDLEDMVRDPDALQMGERIQVRLDTWTAETEGQGQLQLQAAEEGEVWGWKGEEGHV